MTNNPENPYENWIVDRWETPISDLLGITMVALLDATSLCLILEGSREQERPRWSFLYKDFIGYNNILEEYRTKLWVHLDRTKQRYGNTIVVKNSPWINQLSKNEPMVSIDNRPTVHYVILTKDDVIEIISKTYPIISGIEPGKYDKSSYGKSDVYYHPEDEQEVKKIIKRLRKSLQ